MIVHFLGVCSFSGCYSLNNSTYKWELSVLEVIGSCVFFLLA
jgi:hypothetical protein